MIAGVTWGGFQSISDTLLSSCIFTHTPVSRKTLLVASYITSFKKNGAPFHNIKIDHHKCVYRCIGVCILRHVTVMLDALVDRL